eukprot:1943989-Pyramimonas_sp.AAC.1
MRRAMIMRLCTTNSSRNDWSRAKPDQTARVAAIIIFAAIGRRGRAEQQEEKKEEEYTKTGDEADDEHE